MKVQRLIEKYKELYENVFDFGVKLACQNFLKDLEQLDEPEKIAIPQFVADWITHSKNIGRSLFGAMSILEENTEIKKWMQWADNQETFALAWILGYEVEKEKRYLVKVKGVCGNHETLNCEKHSKKWLFSDREENSLYKTKHTRKELEDAGFSEVFNSPLFEVEEVEE